MDMWESPFLELNGVHMRNARTKDSNIKKVTFQFGKSKVEGAHNEIRPVMSLLSWQQGICNFRPLWITNERSKVGWLASKSRNGHCILVVLHH
jgi:hypothetical protein